MASTQNITSLAQFEKEISNGFVVANFWADWAAPSKQMNEVANQLAEKFTNLSFIKVEAEAQPDISEKYEIAAVPTFLFFKDGKKVDIVEGANAPQLSAKVETYSKGLPANQPAQPKEDLNTRLSKLVNAAPVMLFMKGTPEQPQCGFSSKIVAILKKDNLKFSSFNILADNEVREGLKKFSNWPTYPQLYFSGKLIGGLDIVKELSEEGELLSMAPAEAKQ